MKPNETIWLLGDQLSPQHPLLDPAFKNTRTVLLIESWQRPREKRYHQRKLVLLLSAMRHFAASLKAEGWRVDYRQAATFTEGLRAHCAEFQPARLHTMEAAEWNARQQQHKLSERLKLPVTLVPNTLFLIERHPQQEHGKKLILEYFYRAMRKRLGLLIEPDGEPTGGAWNFDHENRKPWKGKDAPPALPAFAPDDITQAVISEINERYPHNIGTTDGFDLAVTRAQALDVLADFIAHRLPLFGTYEDAMAAREPVLFHSVLSPLLNIGLLDPLECAQAAERAYRQGHAPINAVEGFIRQVIGWREYVYWRYHQMMPGFHERNHWQAANPLPAFFWSGETEMRCLSTIIRRVLDTGYSHHIERLMVLCNFALLAGIRPREVNDWFLECYVDAYDWVVTPNVIGMGLCADGGVVGTKPYVASAAYINKMSDYCQGCRFDPKAKTGDNACPFNYLYWNFLLRFEKQLRANPRMGPNVLGLKHLNDTQREAVKRQAQSFLTESLA